MKFRLATALVTLMAGGNALADPVCNAGMLRGLYAFQGDGAKIVSSVQRNAVLSGTVNMLPASVQLVVSTSTFGSAVTVTDRFTGTLTVGAKAFTATVAGAEELNCHGLITLTKKNSATLNPPVKLRLAITHGGNGFYLFNAATDELWSAKAEKI